METCFYCGQKKYRHTILSDGAILCNACFSKISQELRDYARINWDKDGYLQYINKIINSESNAKDIFNPDIRYPSFEYDSINDLYRIERGKIYPAKYISGYNITFKPERISKFLSSYKAVGNMYLQIISVLPMIDKTILLDSQASADGYYEGDGTFKCGFPQKGLKLKKALDNTIGRIKYEQKPNAEQKKIFTDAQNTTNKRSESNVRIKNESNIESAMALFMLDNIQGLTESDLKRQRNRLMKAFHSDEGTESDEYAKKINQAYEILKANI